MFILEDVFGDGNGGVMLGFLLIFDWLLFGLGWGGFMRELVGLSGGVEGGGGGGGLFGGCVIGNKGWGGVRDEFGGRGGWIGKRGWEGGWEGVGGCWFCIGNRGCGGWGMWGGFGWLGRGGLFYFWGGGGCGC